MKPQLIQCIVFVITIIAAYGQDANTSKREQYKVVIVGAGVSGLGAATHLLKNNVTDILILEATDRIGGRVYTAPFGDFLIEYGAQWVYGQGGNVVYDIAKKYNLFVEQNFEKMDLYKSSASKINLTVAAGIFLEAFSFLEDYDALIDCNCSLGSYFDKRFDDLVKAKNIDRYTAEALKDSITKIEASIDATDNLYAISSVAIGGYGQTNGSLDTAWKSGYHTLFEILFGKYDGKELPVMSKIKFNKVVQSIDWSGNEVDILCEDGSHYYAHHVVSTVSLGVLKHSARTMFSPQLPERKLSAIQTIGFDLLNKILIQFETRWWPYTYDYLFNFLWTNEDKEQFRNMSKHGDWSTEVTGFHCVENQPRILEGWISGEAARRLEQLSDKEVTEGVMELFNWFVNGTYSISRPINITRSKWGSNRFVRGSYSFPTVEGDRYGYFPADLAQPLPQNHTAPVLLFAGEATHDYFYGTVQGALESGWREANRILSFQK